MRRFSKKDFYRELSAIATIAYRDFSKLLRDRPRLAASFIFPVLFIGVLGTSLNSSIGRDIGFNFLAFVFTGVFAQSFFQSSAAGVISLIQDRPTSKKSVQRIRTGREIVYVANAQSRDGHFTGRDSLSFKRLCQASPQKL